MRRCRPAEAALLLALVACTPRSSSVPPTTEPNDGTGDAPHDAREAPGEVLRAVVPLIDGGTLDLATLHGTTVVLAMGVTEDPGFAPVRAAIEGLVAGHPEDLAVVVVATDPDADLVSRIWPGGPRSVYVGWDPQGALATRLQVRTLPTMFVLDREGRVVVVRGGADREVLDAVTAAADRAASG